MAKDPSFSFPFSYNFSLSVLKGQGEKDHKIMARNIPCVKVATNPVNSFYPSHHIEGWLTAHFTPSFRQTIELK
jgi:hypothetical protein